MLPRKNSVTVFPASLAPFANSEVNAAVFPVFRGLPFKIMIFLFRRRSRALLTVSFLWLWGARILQVRNVRLLPAVKRKICLLWTESAFP